MYIAYYDEAGDDGYPKYSSPLFILSCVYLNKDYWKAIFNNILNFRRELKEEYGLPVKYELHTKQFLLNKNPYRQHNFSDNVRIEIIEKTINFLSTQNLQIINVVIDKSNIKDAKYKVLKKAFTYSIQRIENTLNSFNNFEKNQVCELLSKHIESKEQYESICKKLYEKHLSNRKFIIITDEGRLHPMCKTAREIQKINYIPSKYEYSSYRNEIELLLEDPIAKQSKESCFIQIADFVSYILYLFMIKKLNIANFPNRLPGIVNEEKLESWMNGLKPILNLKASNRSRYGIVYYPQK